MPSLDVARSGDVRQPDRRIADRGRPLPPALRVRSESLLGADLSSVRNHIDWSEWNAEQQAECISDYNEALRRIDAGNATLADYETVILAEPFIALVRERIGAPGSSRKSREPAAAPAGATP